MRKDAVIEKIGGVTLDKTWLDTTDVYNEGDEVEEKVLSVFREGIDPWTVLAQDDRWPMLYQLSDRRKMIVEPMDIRPTDEVLEIGAGMGPITAAIAPRCAHVDCVELSLRRSLANAYRNQAHDNITIYVGNFEKVILQKKYDVITLVGVLEYAASYIHTNGNPFAEMIRKTAALLNEGGRLYVAIENRLGIKYFAGCREDHLGQVFVGISGYDADSIVSTFTHSELAALLRENGYKEPYFYYPYPDYKLPRIIYSQDVGPIRDSVLTNGENYDMPRFRLFDEQAALHSLIDTDECKVFANSFLVEAVRK